MRTLWHKACICSALLGGCIYPSFCPRPHSWSSEGALLSTKVVCGHHTQRCALFRGAVGWGLRPLLCPVETCACSLRNQSFLLCMREILVTFQSTSLFYFIFKVCLCCRQGRINILIYLRPKYLLASSPRFLGILELSS